MQQVSPIIAGSPVRVVLVLDVSRSVREGQWRRDGTSVRRVDPALPLLRAAARSLIALLQPNDEVAVVTVAERVTVSEAPTTDHPRALAAIDEADEPPRVAPAIDAAHSLVFDAAAAGVVLAAPRPGRSLVVLLTDAADKSSWFTLTRVLDVARQAHVTLDVVSVPDTSDTIDRASNVPLNATDALALIDHKAGVVHRAGDRRLADRLRERVRLLRLSGLR